MEARDISPEVNSNEVIEDGGDDGVKSPTVPRIRARKVGGRGTQLR